MSMMSFLEKFSEHYYRKHFSHILLPRRQIYVVQLQYTVSKVSQANHNNFSWRILRLSSPMHFACENPILLVSKMSSTPFFSHQSSWNCVGRRVSRRNGLRCENKPAFPSTHSHTTAQIYWSLERASCQDSCPLQKEIMKTIIFCMKCVCSCGTHHDTTCTCTDVCTNTAAYLPCAKFSKCQKVSRKKCRWMQPCTNADSLKRNRKTVWCRSHKTSKLIYNPFAAKPANRRAHLQCWYCRSWRIARQPFFVLLEVTDV